jgi:hypothetical protein
MKVDVSGARIGIDWADGSERTTYQLVVVVGGQPQYLEVDEPTFQRAINEARHSNQLQAEPPLSAPPPVQSDEVSFGGDFKYSEPVVSDPTVSWPDLSELDESYKIALWTAGVPEQLPLSKLQSLSEMISRFTEEEWVSLRGQYEEKLKALQQPEEAPIAPLAVAAPSSLMRSPTSQLQNNSTPSNRHSVGSNSQEWVAQIPGLQNPLQRTPPARTVPMDDMGFPIVESAGQRKPSVDMEASDLGEQA